MEIKDIRNILLNKLFINDKIREDFLQNKQFIFNVKFNNMKTFNVKKFTFSKNKTTKNELFNIVKLIIEERKIRALHPNWIILFYEEFNNLGYDIKKVSTDNFVDDIYEVKGKTIKEQINETFKIHIQLLRDQFLAQIIGKKFVVDILFNSTVEYHVKKDLVNKAKFVDLKYQFNKHKLFIEIQEKHHHKETDIQRADEIFSTLGCMPILYYIEEKPFYDIYKQIMCSLARIYMKINEKKGLSLYLVKLNDIPISYAEFYSNIHYVCKVKKKGVKLGEILSYLKNSGFNNPEKIILNGIKEGDINSNHILKGKLIIKKEINSNCRLNFNGILATISYPRVKEWGNSIYIKNYQNKFIDKYFTIIKDILKENLKGMKRLRREYKNKKNIYDMSNYIINDFSINNWNKVIQKYRENNYIDKENREKIKFHKNIPFLVYSKESKVPIDSLFKIFSKDLVNSWYKTIESKKNILNYRFINSKEIKILKNLNLDSIAESNDNYDNSDFEDF